WKPGLWPYRPPLSARPSVQPPAGRNEWAPIQTDRVSRKADPQVFAPDPTRGAFSGPSRGRAAAACNAGKATSDSKALGTIFCNFVTPKLGESILQQWREILAGAPIGRDTRGGTMSQGGDESPPRRDSRLDRRAHGRHCAVARRSRAAAAG